MNICDRLILGAPLPFRADKFFNLGSFLKLILSFVSLLLDASITPAQEPTPRLIDYVVFYTPEALSLEEDGTVAAVAATPTPVLM